MKYLFIIIFAFTTPAQVTKLLVGNKTAPAAATYNYLVDVTGDTLLDVDGDTIKVPASSFIELEQFIKNNEKDIIYSNRLFAILRKRSEC